MNATFSKLSVYGSIGKTSSNVSGPGPVSLETAAFWARRMTPY
jgi:hypothetical protein